MAGRRIRLEINGVSASGELHDDLSPKAAEAFWQSLPLTSTISHAKWSGKAGFIHPGDALKSIETLEYPVCSIYPGTIVIRPRGSEALIAYGQSEYRWATGTDYVTPVAKVTDNREAFLKQIEEMHDVGDKQIKIEREG